MHHLHPGGHDGIAASGCLGQIGARAQSLGALAQCPRDRAEWSPALKMVSPEEEVLRMTRVPTPSPRSAGSPAARCTP